MLPDTDTGRAIAGVKDNTRSADPPAQEVAMQQMLGSLGDGDGGDAASQAGLGQHEIGEMPALDQSDLEGTVEAPPVPTEEDLLELLGRGPGEPAPAITRRPPRRRGSSLPAWGSMTRRRLLIASAIVATTILLGIAGSQSTVKPHRPLVAQHAAPRSTPRLHRVERPRRRTRNRRHPRHQRHVTPRPAPRYTVAVARPAAATPIAHRRRVTRSSPPPAPAPRPSSPSQEFDWESP